jgi:hypothetical protein
MKTIPVRAVTDPPFQKFEAVYSPYLGLSGTVVDLYPSHNYLYPWIVRVQWENQRQFTLSANMLRKINDH